jgi:sigma-B regulation protein RsbQ
MSVIQRNNVTDQGNSGGPTLLFAHGFGCDQNMWRHVAPAFEGDCRVILFDHVGAGKSDASAYNVDKYSRLEGYASDVVQIGRELGLDGAIFVGHSVSAIIGMLASLEAPGMFRSLVLVGPSPCYIDADSYQGGFTRDQIEELLDSLAANHLGWSMTMAPVIMGNPDRPELGEELSNSFCRADPAIAAQFARTTFLSDYRHILGESHVPSLILQCSDDLIAPLFIGEYMHARMPGSKLVVMKATGHCPNLSAPAETIAAIRDFI